MSNLKKNYFQLLRLLFLLDTIRAKLQLTWKLTYMWVKFFFLVEESVHYDKEFISPTSPLQQICYENKCRELLEKL